MNANSERAAQEARHRRIGRSAREREDIEAAPAVHAAASSGSIAFKETLR